MVSSSSDGKESECRSPGNPGSASSGNHQEHKKMSQAKIEKAQLHDFEHHVKDIRTQLGEQLKCIGDRTDTQVAVLSEVEDFFRKRGECEEAHAKQLEKLAKNSLQRHKTDKSRRENWSQHAACGTWQQMVDDTKNEAQQRQALADLYLKTITASISSRCDDLVRISKKCREIGSLSHNEINRVLAELHTAMKTYQLCYAEMSGVEKKMRIALDDKRRYEDGNGTRNSRKYKSLVKTFTKREEKFNSVGLKCTKARNEYLMCVKAANAALHRFFAQDLSYLIDCMDLGMDFWMKSLLGAVIEQRNRICQQEMVSLAELGTIRSALDSKADKQRFFEGNHGVFALPKQFEFRAQLGDSVAHVSAEPGLFGDLGQRRTQIEKRLEGLRFESDEEALDSSSRNRTFLMFLYGQHQTKDIIMQYGQVWKTLEASERKLLQLYNGTTEDMSKWRNDLIITYNYYLKKFEYFLLNGNLIERLEARSIGIGEALSRARGQAQSDPPMEERARKRIRRIGTGGELCKPRPKLFGGSLDEYAEATGESIPLLVTSAIRYLSRFSLRNQGLFRVSGSQSEINRFKEAYENGDDVFSELTDGSESNSVAGVLKLYLRELREPLFPLFLFDQFTDCAKAESSAEFIRKASDLIGTLPMAHVLLLRFLFAFLSHLCEFADENMMEPYNMAICFGPTLLPIPEGKDQVFYHNYVNEFVRNLIVHAVDVFPQDLPGSKYDKYLIADDDVDQLGAYLDENELMSEDDDCGASSGPMLDSTYEVSLDGIQREDTVSTLQAASPVHLPLNLNRSGRESKESGAGSGCSGDLSPSLMSHRIASELNAMFAQRDMKLHSPSSNKSNAIWEQSCPSSSSSQSSHTPLSLISPISGKVPLRETGPPGNKAGTTHSLGPASGVQMLAPSQTASVPSSGFRLPPRTSLRDQLNNFRKELNHQQDSKVYPLSESTSKGSGRFITENEDVLDARSSNKDRENKPEVRTQTFEYSNKLSMDQESDNYEPESKCETPDVVASARTRAQSEVAVRKRSSSSLEDLTVALNSALQFD